MVLDSLVIAETQVGKKIALPARVAKNYNLRKGDVLRWLGVYQGMDIDIPPREIRDGNIIIIQVQRGPQPQR